MEHHANYSEPIESESVNHIIGIGTLESNRWDSVEKGSWVQVQTLDIPNDGLVVWLRDFGQVKLFRTHLKNQVRHYAMYLPDDKNSSDDREKFSNLNQIEFDKLHSQHWHIEQYHRAIKQVCNIESFQVRGKPL